LTKQGHPISDRTVARMLREQGFSLQGNAKVIEGKQHADPTPSSSTWPGRSVSMWPPASRSCRLTRKRRSW
jgi:hypothetical protein